MYQLPATIKNLIQHFAKLPGLGPKSSERLVFYLLTKPKDDLIRFSQAIIELNSKISLCPICQNFIENNRCYICNDSNRHTNIICVVAKPQDIAIIEKTGIFNGIYHILGGVLSPLNGVTQENLNIATLLERIAKNNIAEIILAFNPDIEGEQTGNFLKNLIKNQKPQIKITRLARGLPMGSDLEYADEITVSDALKGRREL